MAACAERCLDLLPSWAGFVYFEMGLALLLWLLWEFLFRRDRPDYRPLFEAVDHVGEALGIPLEERDKVLAVLRQAARDGVVVIRGRTQDHALAGTNLDSQPKTNIESEYWEHCDIDGMTVFVQSRDPDRLRTYQTPHTVPQRPKYHALEVDMRSVRDEWPLSWVRWARAWSEKRKSA